MLYANTFNSHMSKSGTTIGLLEVADGNFYILDARGLLFYFGTKWHF